MLLAKGPDVLTRLLIARCPHPCGILPRLAAGLVLLAMLFAAPWAVAQELKKASFMPLWAPQAQFAGYYVAREKGIYAKHGIDLTILRAGPGHSPFRALVEGRAEFAVLWLTTALQHRAQGAQLVNLAQIVPKSSMLLVSRKSSGINSPEDMRGRKVGLWDGDLSIPARALFASRGVKVREVLQSHTVNLFLRGGIDVTSAMWYNEYHTILNAGIDADELNVMPLGEHGMNVPEDGLYILEDVLRWDPELAAAFVAASLEGWRYAFEHPEEALDIVIARMHEAKIPASRAHQRWMLDRMRDLVVTDTAGGVSGELSEQDYLAACRAMHSNGLIRSYPDFREFFWRRDAGKK